MENVAPVLFLLLRLLCMASSHARSYDTPRYDTAYACEGKVLKIECREGELIHLIRANYGRFSITICNDHGNTEWSVNCMSPKSLRVLLSKCSLQPNCTIPASTSMFGDPCPGTLKYLEAHFRCVPATTTTTTSRPNPPWLLTSQPSVWTSSRMTSLRPPVRGGTSDSPTTANINKLPWPSMEEIGNIVTPGPSPAITSGTVREPPAEVDMTIPEHRPPAPSWKTTVIPTETHSSPTPPADVIVSSTTIASTWKPNGEHLHFCAPTSTRGLYWNWTKPNEVDVQPCPGGANGVARWRCVQNGAGVGWFGESPDLSECRSVWLTSLDSRIDEGESLVNIANDLSQVTSSNALYGGDMMTTTDIVKKITDKMSKNIETFPDPSQREAIVTELLQSVLRTTSNLIDSAQTAGWGDLSHDEQMRVATSLLIGLEENAFLLADTVIREINVVQTVKNILLSVRVMKTQNLESEVFPAPGERDITEESDDPGDQLIVPKGAMADNSEGGLVRIVFVAFQRLEEILVPDTEEAKPNSTRVVNSRIISASLGKGRHIQFAQWVRITLAHIRTENVSNPVCVFWDYTMSAWSQEGCEIVTTNKTHSVCRCNHLTNFAILMDVHDTQLDPGHQLALQIITYVGCIVSIVCLLLAVITFHLFRGLKSDRNTIHKNLCFCLLVAEVLFLLGIGQTDKPIACGVVAGLLHFIFLCAFAWMFLEGFQLYVMLVEVFEAEKSRMRWYYMFAYGAPLLIVCVSCVVDPLSYGTNKYCWLRADNFFIFSFVGPVIAVILANLVFLSMAIYMMCRHSATGVTVKSKEHTRLANARSWLRGAIVLVFLLGLTWTFGLLYLNEGTVVMAYIFTILNSLQGLFIFLFHCLNNEKVRKEYRKCASWLPWCSQEPYDAPEGKDGRASNTSASTGTHVHTPRVEAPPPASPPAALVANGHNKMYYKAGREPEEIADGRESRATYAERASTLGDVRRQAYRHGQDRVLVIELERQNGARAATLHVAKRRRERHQSDSRRGEVDDPVYEEIRQTASDMSDEDMRRGVVSRQSLRSYGDHSPLIPSPHNPAYPPYPNYNPYPPYAHGTIGPHSHVVSQSPRSMQSLHSVHSLHSLHQAPDPYLYAPRGHDR